MKMTLIVCLDNMLYWTILYLKIMNSILFATSVGEGESAFFHDVPLSIDKMEKTIEKKSNGSVPLIGVRLIAETSS